MERSSIEKERSRTAEKKVKVTRDLRSRGLE